MPSMARSNPIGEIIIGLLMALGGAWVFGRELLIWHDASAARGWAVTSGLVERSDGSCTGSMSRYGGGRSCTMRGRYTYEVLSKPYVGHRFTFDDINVGPHRTLDSLVRRFWPGTQVVVYYDPNDPSSAVLDRSNRFNIWMTMGGGFLLIVGLVVSGRRLVQWWGERHAVGGTPPI